MVYLIMLLVLIPYFLSITGVTYQISGEPHTVTLNSDGEVYDMLYIYDQESYAAKWLKEHVEKRDLKVYGDQRIMPILASQGVIAPWTEALAITKPREVKDYVYLRYDNVINDRLYIEKEYHNIPEYTIMFVGKNKIYDNGGSEIYK